MAFMMVKCHAATALWGYEAMIYVFGDCELDTHLYELRREGPASADVRRAVPP